MRRILQNTVIFNKELRTLDFTAVPNFNINKVFSITNVAAGKNTHIYLIGITGYGYTNILGSVITLQFDTTDMNNNDTLLINYDDLLEDGVAMDGVDSTGISPPSGGSGIRGWLSGIFNKLNTGIALAASDTSGLKNYKIRSLSSTNTTVVKSSFGNLYGFTLCNNTNNAKYIKFYNTSTVPIIGLDLVEFTIIIPGRSSISSTFPTGSSFTTGISYAITASVEESNNTPVSENDVVGVILFF
jgi:hypothetical protein